METTANEPPQVADTPDEKVPTPEVVVSDQGASTEPCSDTPEVTQEHTGAKIHFLSRNSFNFHISKLWILWKMRFQ